MELVREKPSLLQGKWRFWGTLVPLVALDLGSKAAVLAFLGATGLGNPSAVPEHIVWSGPVHFHLTAGSVGEVRVPGQDDSVR